MISARKHIFVSSNPWFSAASEYMLQLIRFLQQDEQNTDVEFYCERKSKALSFAEAWRIPSFPLRLRPKGLIASLISPFILLRIWIEACMSSQQSSLVWVLEGHEHTWMTLFRSLTPEVWRPQIIRLRLQDRFREDRCVGVLKRLMMAQTRVYVFPSQVALSRMHPPDEPGRYIVQHFCKNFASAPLRHEEPDQRTCRFLYLGRFDPVKGLDVLLRAFQLLEKSEMHGELEQIELLLVGRSENVHASELIRWAAPWFPQIHQSLGDDGVKVYEMSSASDCKRIRILDGKVADLYGIFSQCQFAVIPSQGSEIICRTAVEFMQFGLPIVSSGVGSLSETLGAAALRYEPAYEAKELAQVLRECLRHSQDAEKMRMLREEAFMRGEQFQLRGFARLLHEIEKRLR